VGGSGDVLSGLIGGLLARTTAQFTRINVPFPQEQPFDVASAMRNAVQGGVLIHGMAGKALWHKQGWFTPRQLAWACGKIIAKKEDHAILSK